MLNTLKLGFILSFALVNVSFAQGISNSSFFRELSIVLTKKRLDLAQIKLEQSFSKNSPHHQAYISHIYDSLGLGNAALNAASTYLDNPIDNDEINLLSLAAYWHNVDPLAAKATLIPSAEDWLRYDVINKTVSLSLRSSIYQYFAGNLDYPSALNLYTIEQNGTKMLSPDFYADLEKNIYSLDGPIIEDLYHLNKLAKNDIEIYFAYAEYLLREGARSVADVLADIRNQTPLFAERVKWLDNANNFRANTFTVGVLVPLSDKFKNIGDSLISGINFGYYKYGLGRYNIRLVYANQGNSLEDLDRAYRHLVTEENASLILGPVTKLSSEHLQALGNALAVPYISYSITADRKKLAKNSVILQRNRNSEAREVAAAAIKELCLNKAVIVYPPEDRAARDEFVANFQLNGGLVAKEFELRNYKSDLASVFNTITGSGYYLGGGSLHDASENISSSDVEFIYSTLPEESVGLIVNFLGVFNSRKISLIGDSNMASITNPSATDKGISIWYGDSVSNSEINKTSLHNIWSQQPRSNFGLTDSYSYYGLVSAAILKKLADQSLDLFTVKRLLNSSKIDLQDFGTFYKTDQNEYYQPASLIRVSESKNKNNCKATQ